MNLLFIGDIFASAGRNIVARHLQDIISKEKIDLAIANAENSAGGFGITPLIAQELFSIGLEVLTTGNHVWDKKELFDYLPREPRLFRRFSRRADQREDGDGLVSERQGLGDGRDAHAYPDGRRTHLIGRNRLPDRCRYDRPLRFRNRIGKGAGAATVPDLAADPSG